MSVRKRGLTWSLFFKSPITCAPGRGGIFDCFFIFLCAFFHSMQVFTERYSISCASSGGTAIMPDSFSNDGIERGILSAMDGGILTVELISSILGGGVSFGGEFSLGNREKVPVRARDLGGTGCGASDALMAMGTVPDVALDRRLLALLATRARVLISSIVVASATAAGALDSSRCRVNSPS